MQSPNLKSIASGTGIAWRLSGGKNANNEGAGVTKKELDQYGFQHFNNSMWPWLNGLRHFDET